MGLVTRTQMLAVKPQTLHAKALAAEGPGGTAKHEKGLAEELRIWLEKRGPGDLKEAFGPLSTGEGIEHLRLRLKNAQTSLRYSKEKVRWKGHHGKRNRRAVGGASDKEGLDLSVKLSDIESVSAQFHGKRPEKASPKSALTEYFKGVSHTQPASEGLERLSHDPTPKAVAANVQPPALEDLASWYVHLRVRPTATVTLERLKKGKCELQITASKADTVESLRRKAEQQGLLASSFDVVFNGQKLSSSKPLVAYGVSKGSVLELVPIDASCAPELAASSPPLSSPDHALFPKWQKARAGLACGRVPQLAPAGSGGSYFMTDEDGNNVAVFKPADEEPLAANNPKGRHIGSEDGHGLRHGIYPGEGAVREVAAYLLDHDHFSGVPPTALVTCKHLEEEQPWSEDIKIGSLQAYIKSDGDCEEQGYSLFPCAEVAKIAVLDIRLANTDRNGSNILVSRGPDGTIRLTPIDHGYCLPSSLQDITFEWLYWPQARQPFNAAATAYIRSLDAEADLALLDAHGLHIRPECARIFRACTLLLKMGAEAKLTPYQIGSLMCRDGEKESMFEHMFYNAALKAHRGGAIDVGDRTFLGLLRRNLEAHVHQCVSQCP
eukprot:jgi/Botrbrau1/15469/Bobra.43_2s0091.1